MRVSPAQRGQIGPGRFIQGLIDLLRFQDPLQLQKLAILAGDLFRQGFFLPVVGRQVPDGVLGAAQEHPDRFRPDRRLEFIVGLPALFPVFLFRQELFGTETAVEGADFQPGLQVLVAVAEAHLPGVDHDVIFIIDHALQNPRREPEDIANPAGGAFEKPDVGDRDGELDHPHPLPAD